MSRADDLIAVDNPTAPAEVIRSEERARVGYVWAPVERVRISRRVITETRMVEVTLRREVLYVERLSIDSDQAEAELAQRETPARLVIVLSEEVPVISTQVRPVERVRISVQRVRGEQAVTTELRQEQIVVERLDQPDVR